MLRPADRARCPGHLYQRCEEKGGGGFRGDARLPRAGQQLRIVDPQLLGQGDGDLVKRRRLPKLLEQLGILLAHVLLLERLLAIAEYTVSHISSAAPRVVASTALARPRSRS